jgi:hypothetical protein
MHCLSDLFACPLPAYDGTIKKAVAVFGIVNKTHGDDIKARLTSVFEEIELKLGIHLSFTSMVEQYSDPDETQGSCYNAANMKSVALVHVLSQRILAEDWFSVAEDDQTFGVFARCMKDPANRAAPLTSSPNIAVSVYARYLEVVAIKCCARAEEGGVSVGDDDMNFSEEDER